MGLKPAQAVLVHSGVLSDQQLADIRSAWDERYRGRANAHKTAILEGGMACQSVEAETEGLAAKVKPFREPLPSEETQ